VCLHELDFFGAVGIWYERFGEVSEGEVERLLGRRTPPEGREVGGG
jgi:predicted phosphoribosyltransferase